MQTLGETAPAAAATSSDGDATATPVRKVVHAYSRERFASRLQFLVASLGFAVGLGNVYALSEE